MKRGTQVGHKLVQINTVANGSIGKIMKETQIEAEKQGFTTISFVGRRKIYTEAACEKFGNPISFLLHVAVNTVFDRQGHSSWLQTKKLIKRLREEKPDIIHLHNLHGYYLNIPMLIRYLKEEYKGKLLWTFHDCWAFTGHCPYFTMVECDKWKKGCEKCPNKNKYPISFGADRSKKNYIEKKNWFSNLPNLKIIVPSEWMKAHIVQSFMNEYPIEVIPNGVDQKIFCRRSSRQIYSRYNIPVDKKILLGVADMWSERKGISDFLNLAEKLPQNYQIVLIGKNKDRRIKKYKNITGIPYTENSYELAEFYSEAFAFLNPSREESFSVVTAEALSCGTPAIVLDTSAVKELVTEKTGIVLHRHGTDDYLDAIKKIEKNNFDSKEIAKYARKFSAEQMTEKIITLYRGE